METTRTMHAGQELVRQASRFADRLEEEAKRIREAIAGCGTPDRYGRLKPWGEVAAKDPYRATWIVVEAVESARRTVNHGPQDGFAHALACLGAAWAVENPEEAAK